MKADLFMKLTCMVNGVGSVTVSDVARELETLCRKDPMKAARAVGALYGATFKRKEAALNPWTPPEE